ncbi:hypothetical protein Rsub_03326 [Raphidocelis subcapitata]|uniref:Uncharacterized protein n=1 Tax=Raphidocelis subcapitata TaxID=307507 RepID=A0A2V0NXA0_9CHLO|nr:hypothetical protein Rsub_03326 [Raphidocelis subcapitata]|eukprot:GBF90193.1 hypothetical protein Rsub_03326 [Raphidocelis subcapitata]
MFGLRFGAGGPFGWGLPRRPRPQRRARRPAASSGAGGIESYSQRVAGWEAPVKAGVISGSMSAIGDLLAQLLSMKEAESRGAKAPAYDLARTLRMLGFGLLWYGPYQYYWYNLLDWAMPARSTANFATKVLLNQVALAPVVLAVVFAWNLSLTGEAQQIPGKIRRDMVPSMVNGWKFWVPAASINFYFVPLDKQVLYMSACGVLWTAYLSYASANAVGKVEPPPPEPAAAKKRKSKWWCW